MVGAPARARSDEALATVLAALASPNRLALLRQVQVPRILTEIRLAPEDGAGGNGAGVRPIARQAVKDHLRKLMEAGVVVAQPVERDFGDTFEYVVNHQRLFAISEELRELAHLRPVEERVVQPTMEDNRPAVQRAVYPRLLVVRGLGEGTSYAVRPPDGAPEASWVVGRKRGVAISVDYDPFVSFENTLVTWKRGEYAVEDLPQSRNGTTLNFAKLPRAEPAPLAHGDVLGVGHTLFVFQAQPGRQGKR